jgi:hypothetical protein
MNNRAFLSGYCYSSLEKTAEEQPVDNSNIFFDRTGAPGAADEYTPQWDPYDLVQRGITKGLTPIVGKQWAENPYIQLGTGLAAYQALPIDKAFSKLPFPKSVQAVGNPVANWLKNTATKSKWVRYPAGPLRFAGRMTPVMLKAYLIGLTAKIGYQFGSSISGGIMAARDKNYAKEHGYTTGGGIKSAFKSLFSSNYRKENQQLRDAVDPFTSQLGEDKGIRAALASQNMLAQYLQANPTAITTEEDYSKLRNNIQKRIMSNVDGYIQGVDENAVNEIRGRYR